MKASVSHRPHFTDEAEKPNDIKATSNSTVILFKVLTQTELGASKSFAWINFEFLWLVPFCGPSKPHSGTLPDSASTDSINTRSRSFCVHMGSLLPAKSSSCDLIFAIEKVAKNLEMHKRHSITITSPRSSPSHSSKSIKRRVNAVKWREWLRGKWVARWPRDRKHEMVANSGANNGRSNDDCRPTSECENVAMDNYLPDQSLKVPLSPYRASKYSQMRGSGAQLAQTIREWRQCHSLHRECLILLRRHCNWRL